MDPARILRITLIDGDPNTFEAKYLVEYYVVSAPNDILLFETPMVPAGDLLSEINAEGTALGLAFQ